MNMLAAEVVGLSVGTALLQIQVRSLALLLPAALLLFILRRQSAELQHFLCRCVLYSFWLLPALTLTAPPLRPPSPIWESARVTAFPDRPTILPRHTMASAMTITITPVRHRRFSWTFWIASAYSFVTLVLLLRLARNVSLVWQVVRRSQPIFDSDFRELTQEIWLRSLARYRPQIRVSDEIHVPMAVGIHELTILLPVQWQVWPHEKRRAVLAHEMAHVRREDPQTAFLASLTVCFFWLNPMMYWLRQ